MAKGSEQKVYRLGGKQFTFGCHGIDRKVHPVQIKNCLGKLGIPLGDFIAACGRQVSVFAVGVPSCE